MEHDLVWHYTSIDTLTKICKTLKLRATHHAFLNDYTEIAHGARIISELVEEHKSRAPNSDSKVHKAMRQIAQRRKISDDAAKLKAIADKIQKCASGNDLDSFYIISFSRARDLLSQWRGYAPHSGCAIGVDKNVLSRAFVDIVPDVGECIYWDTPSIEMKTSALIIAEGGANFLGLCPEKLAEKIAKKAKRQVAFTKNTGFSEEEEFRLVFKRNSEEIFFENGKPFIEVSIRKDIFPELIKEVVIAPNCGDQEKRYVDFLSCALASSYKKTKLFEVTTSSLTFN